MPDAPPSALSHPWGPRLVRLRLVTGLVLFIYATAHLANHALGLISLAAMEQGRHVFLGFWRLPPIEIVLLLSLVLHAALGLHRLWERRGLRLAPLEAAQLALGLMIPSWLVVHILGTRWLSLCCGVKDSYAYFLDLVWPGGALQQAIMLIIVWLHGCIGIRAWLRLKPFYHALRPWLAGGAVLLPTLALTGYLAGGRDVALLRAVDPEAWAALGRAQGWMLGEAIREAWVYRPTRLIVDGFLALALSIPILRAVRFLVMRRRTVRLFYPGGGTFTVPRGLTVLEASRAHGIPHAAVCGGRGRCSTCRVRVGRGRERLLPPSAEEQRVLARVGAAEDVRLACQIRPSTDLMVTPLLPAETSVTASLRPMNPGQGREREIAVMFADLRGFTRLSESRLPYDTVFVLNRYFQTMGVAIEGAGGRIDKFIGDGIMALFGIEGPPQAGAGAALAAARRMAEALEVLNRDLKADLPEPLRMGVGLHFGQAIVGEMGYGRAVSLTAIGDTVNVASRLEALTKELGAQLIVSAALLRRAGLAHDDLQLREIELPGRGGGLAVLVLADARALPQPAEAAASARSSGLDRLRGWRRRLASST